MPRLLVPAALVALLLPAAAEAAPKRCRSGDLHYAFNEGQPKFFGVHRLREAAAQTYDQRGRKGKTTIRFDYVVPNG